MQELKTTRRNNRMSDSGNHKNSSNSRHRQKAARIPTPALRRGEEGRCIQTSLEICQNNFVNAIRRQSLNSLNPGQWVKMYGLLEANIHHSIQDLLGRKVSITLILNPTARG